jgi:hypothetical protein
VEFTARRGRLVGFALSALLVGLVGRTRELNRCEPDSVEPLRRVDAGAKPILDWDGPPWAPDGNGKYQQDAHGSWWPTASALADGYQPCKACRRPSAAI